MNADFDKAAVDYDADFTHSEIGKYQRSRVWKYLLRSVNGRGQLSILELNCGTGEDAKRLASYGHIVTATDISYQMLDVARAKNYNNSVRLLRVDLNQLGEHNFSNEFDVVFSNFGGLNCIDHHTMKKLGRQIIEMLKPQGQFISVIMPQFCLIESIYFLLKHQKSAAFRRAKEYAIANVSGQSVKTWYFSPKRMSSLMPPSFTLLSVKPIGLFLPPSYLAQFFTHWPTVLTILNKLELWFGHFRWQAAISDHYFIQFVKR